MKLGSIANVGTGVVLSRKAATTSNENNYEYSALSLRSLGKDGGLNPTLFESFVSKEELHDKYITRAGDVIMRLSEPYTAVYITNEFEGLIIPSHFVLVRMISNEKFIPEYIAYYLNSDFTLKQLAAEAVGSKIQIIKSSFLKELEVVEATIENQKVIAELTCLHRKEVQLLNELIKEKEKLNKSVLEKMIRGGLLDGQKDYTKRD